MATRSGISRGLSQAGYALILVAVGAAAQESDFGQDCAPVPVHRIFNSTTGSHFLTVHVPQKEFLTSSRPDYRYEGIVYYAYATKAVNSVGVSRLYSGTANAHFYTTSDSDKAAFKSQYPDAVDEGFDHYLPLGMGGGAVEIARFSRNNGLPGTYFARDAAEIQLYTRPDLKRDAVQMFAFPASMSAASMPTSRCEPGPIWRFMHKTSIASFLTPSEAEKKFLEVGRPDYQYQGIAFYAHGPGATTPGVSRLFNASTQTHFYTTSDTERAAYLAAGATNEGVNFSVQPSSKATAADITSVYRLKHPTTQRYLFAVSMSERDNWIKTHGFKDDGVLLACLKSAKPTNTTGNKSPTVTLAAPAYLTQLPASVKLTATATDADGTIAKVEFYSGAVKLSETTAPPHEYTWSNITSGSYAVMAVATDDKGARGNSNSMPVMVAAAAQVFSDAQKDAARLLTQATFGIKSQAEIDAVAAAGTNGWLNQQFAMGWSSHVAYVDAAKARETKAKEEHAYEAIWQQWLNEPGQLRARMAFALSQIFVISNIAPDLDTYAMASYMDLLNRNAFGNYRTLLGEVALHPAMGHYLNMQGSKKEDPAKGTHPNENFAREVMQLFSIGLYKLNADGSRVIGGDGKPVSTYDETVVKGFARAFSGWNFAGNNTSDPKIFDPAKENWLEPMQAWEMMHEPGTKNLLDGKVLPAGQTARKDLDDALDTIFNHPNVGPFIGRQLIQRFVTSNPSPAYIGRVAAAFNNNGSGVRGDFKAVLTAVLNDPEARSLASINATSWGKQREPVIRFANVLRGLNATSPTGRNRIWYLDDADDGLGQSPLLAPSVFNFFSPNYRQPGPLATANLVAPEFQITTETSMVGQLNFFAKLVKNASYGSGDTKLTLNLDALNALATDPVKLVDALNLQFMNGLMTPNTRNVMLTKLAAMPASKPVDRTKAALTMLSLSPEFAIQK
jgi:uncharacterized protein (DUF1800 family)